METTMARDASLIGGIMISRKWLVAYWVATVFVAGTGAAAGTMDILRLEPFFGMLTRMGYPAYFSTILGTWKVLGAVALLVPGYPRLKEWAYAGMFIDYTAATASYLAVGAGGAAAFVDAEHALDPGYARNLGVKIDELLVSQPDYGEQALEITNALVSSGVIDVVVVDSVAALVPKAELDGEMGDSFMGLHARLMSQALRKITGAVARSNTCMIFINQVREKIGVVFGNPETTTGGRALKFYSSVRVDIRRMAALKDGDKVIGNRTKVKVVKNKVAAPFREAEVDILYGEGFSREGDLLDLGSDQGIVEKSGSWFSYAGERLGQGRETARVFLKEHPEIRKKIESAVREKLGLGIQPRITTSEEPRSTAKTA